VAGLAKQHERTVGELEALGERRLSRASGIIRNTIGEVRRGDGVSEMATEGWMKLARAK
jgi:hypothetical protein